MKNNTRINRVNDEILREVSIILRQDISDPRIGLITTATKVETTPDLKFCKIFVSVLGDSDAVASTQGESASTDLQKKEVMSVLKSASGYIRRLLAERINLRNTPELKFVLDNTLDYSIRITKLMEGIVIPKDVSEEKSE